MHTNLPIKYMCDVKINIKYERRSGMNCLVCFGLSHMSITKTDLYDLKLFGQLGFLAN